MDHQTPHGMETLAKRFLESLRVRNYSPLTVETRHYYLRCFLEWASARGLVAPQEVTKPVIERYQKYLFHYRQKNGEPLSFRTQHARLLAVRAFFRWLAKGNFILFNPAADIDLSKLEHRLPKHVLTVSEAEQVLNQTDATNPLGIRDRAMLEVFYSTGIRRAELARLRLYDLDQGRETLFVRQGKGKKDRVVPIGDRAIAWVHRYVHEVRPRLLTSRSPADLLFLTYLGEAFCPMSLSILVKRYVDAAEIGKSGSCHLFRHTMATLMLEGGADIRYIQMMLGHARLESTQIYAQVSIRKLKEVHTQTHPAHLKRPG